MEFFLPTLSLVFLFFGTVCIFVVGVTRPTIGEKMVWAQDLISTSRPKVFVLLDVAVKYTVEVLLEMPPRGCYSYLGVSYTPMAV